MYIIRTIANEIGRYKSIQEWTETKAPGGFSLCPDEFYEKFCDSDGFVTLFIDENNIVTSMETNTEALEAYLASLPEPDPEEVVPSVEDKLTALEQSNAELSTQNKLLTEQIAALTEQMEFYEGCIVEMAEQIYA